MYVNPIVLHTKTTEPVLDQRKDQKEKFPPQFSNQLATFPLLLFHAKPVSFLSADIGVDFRSAVCCIKTEEYKKGLQCAQKGLNALHKSSKKDTFREEAYFYHLRAMHHYLLGEHTKVIEDVSILLIGKCLPETAVWALLMRAHCFLCSNPPLAEAAFNSIKLALELRPSYPWQAELSLCKGFAHSILGEKKQIFECYIDTFLLLPKHPHLAQLKKLA